MEKNIRVISARAQFEAHFPGDSRSWKREAFLGLRKEYDKEV